MKQIRRNVFETNSSSTHSLSICTEEMYKQWKDGKVLYSQCENEFIVLSCPTEQDYAAAKEKYNKDKQKYYKDWEALTAQEQEEYTHRVTDLSRGNPFSGYKTYDAYLESIYDGCEFFNHSFTTPSGDKMMAFGYYGYDG